MTAARWLAAAVLVAAAVFAVTGGRYSVAEYRKVVVREELLSARVDSLVREIDSLRAFRDSLRDRPDVQERVARARSGMIRPGEFAVLLVPDVPVPDSGEDR